MGKLLYQQKTISISFVDNKTFTLESSSWNYLYAGTDAQVCMQRSFQIFHKCLLGTHFIEEQPFTDLEEDVSLFISALAVDMELISRVNVRRFASHFNICKVQSKMVSIRVN
jgi:hypothetical protein